MVGSWVAKRVVGKADSTVCCLVVAWDANWVVMLVVSLAVQKAVL